MSTLLCENIRSMKTFHHKILGLSTYRDQGEWVEWKIGATLPTLRRRGRPYDAAKLPDTAGVQLAFRVAHAEVEASYQKLLTNQVGIIDPAAMKIMVIVLYFSTILRRIF